MIDWLWGTILLLMVFLGVLASYVRLLVTKKYTIVKSIIRSVYRLEGYEFRNSYKNNADESYYNHIIEIEFYVNKKLCTLKKQYFFFKRPKINDTHYIMVSRNGEDEIRLSGLMAVILAILIISYDLCKQFELF